MTASLTKDQIVRSLVAQGVPRAKAEQVAGVRSTTSQPAASSAPLTFPIRLVLPWSALCSDNDKYGAAIVGGRDNPRPKLLLKPDYREAKRKTAEIGAEAMQGHGPIARPLALIARVYVPNDRLHDVVNFAKCAHDGLERVVYANDTWLHDARWIRAGVDVDHPRAELEIQPL